MLDLVNALIDGPRSEPIEIGARHVTVRTCLSQEFARQIALERLVFQREVYIWNVFDVPRKEWTNPFGLEERDYVFKVVL